MGLTGGDFTGAFHEAKSLDDAKAMVTAIARQDQLSG